MTADIFASLQTYANTQAQQQVMGNVPQTDSDTQDGRFAALMTEYASAAEEMEAIIPAAVEPEQQLMTFTANSSFVQAVMNILAGEAESAEDVQMQEDEALPLEAPADDEVIWPEDEAAEAVHRVIAGADELVNAAETKDTDIEHVVSEIPEDLSQETAQAVNDIVAELKHEDGGDTQPVVKMLSTVAEKPVPKADDDLGKTKDEHEESDDMPENKEAAAELAGLAGIAVSQTQPQEAPSSEQEHTVISDTLTRDKPSSRQVRQTRTVQAETPAQADEASESPENKEAVSNFREVLENADNEEDSGQDRTDNQNQSQNQSSSQGRGDSGTRDSSTRSRRTDSREPTGIPESPSGTVRRAESRSDFQAYFEGVLTSRRTVSRTSPAPLDLRGTENFTQASGLRDGLTNVVRFIRADGVQKARVVVDPPALGRISVELASGTSGVEASIKVSSEQIRQLVQDQISQLRMNLSQQGVQVAEFTVDVFTGQQDNSGNHNPQGQQQNGQYVNFFGDSEDDETEEFRIDLEDGLLYWVA